MHGVTTNIYIYLFIYLYNTWTNLGTATGGPDFRGCKYRSRLIFDIFIISSFILTMESDIISSHLWPDHLGVHSASLSRNTAHQFAGVKTAGT